MALSIIFKATTQRPKKNIFQPSRGHCLLLVLLWVIYSELSILDVFKSYRGYSLACGIYLYVFEYCALCLFVANFPASLLSSAMSSGIVRGPAGSNDCRIYVGNLPPDIRSKDIEDLFYKFGAIRDIDLKNRRGGPPFAFVEFEDPR